MTVYRPEIPLSVGDTVFFNSEGYRITGRADDDTFEVKTVPGDGTEERHIDWFADKASHAGRVYISRGGR